MNKEIVTKKLSELIYNLLHITVSDKDTNLFSTDYHITSVTMVYFLLELEHEFHITINDKFMDELPCITINNLTNAICVNL